METTSTDDDVDMDGNEGNDVNMNQTDKISIDEINDHNDNNDNNDKEPQTNHHIDPPKKGNNDNDDSSDNDDNDAQNSKNMICTQQNDTESNENSEGNLLLNAKINEFLSSVPDKLEHCSKPTFYLVLLLIVEVKNIESQNKIDYLLLFNFLTNLDEFKSFDQFSFGAEILKLPKHAFLTLFAEKTDFDTKKIADIYDILATNNTTPILTAFRDNSNKIDMQQTWDKIVNCGSNLQDSNEGEIEEKKEEKPPKNESWKSFKIGDKFDCKDRWQNWYFSQIKKHKKATDIIPDAEWKEMDKKKQKQKAHLNSSEAIYVHYIGWDQKYDEWVFIDTESDIFCDCDDNDEGDKCFDPDHRLSAAKTQSEYKKRKKKQYSNKPLKAEPIKYKIKDFNKLVVYIGKTYEAPNGCNRTGIGAECYAEAQLHGPGGNLTKFILWDKQRKYERFHHSHYDWWMFPNDRDSWGQGRKYALFQKDIEELLEVEGYADNYRLGARLVLKSWGWDMDKMCFITDGTSAQKWTGYNVRLLKMLYSTIILKQWDVYESVYKFCIGVLEKGSQFRSEPMMYEYLGLQKPKYVRRWAW